MAAHRSSAEFAEFAHTRSPALFRAAYLMVGERGLAEDLLQEDLTKTYVAWPRLRDVGKAESTSGGRQLLSRPTGVVQPASGKYVDAQVTYAVGSTFHYGDQLIDVSPHKVATFVQTDDGFVFTDDSGAIFFSDGDQSVQIGEPGQPYGRLLTADDSGSYVGWVDTSAAPAAEFVVYNTSSRGEVVRTSAGNQPTSDQTGEFDLPMMVAIDGQFAYWHSSAGMTAWNLSNGTADLLAPGATYKWLQDAAGGQLAKMSKNGQQIVVSCDPAAADPAFPGWSGVALP